MVLAQLRRMQIIIRAFLRDRIAVPVRFPEFPVLDRGRGHAAVNTEESTRLAVLEQRLAARVA